MIPRPLAAGSFINAELRKEIENLRADVDGKFQDVFETLDQLLTVDSKPKKVGFLKEEQAKYVNRPRLKVLDI